jgi:hypothetical protein
MDPHMRAWLGGNSMVANMSNVWSLEPASPGETEASGAGSGHGSGHDGSRRVSGRLSSSSSRWSTTPGSTPGSSPRSSLRSERESLFEPTHPSSLRSSPSLSRRASQQHKVWSANPNPDPDPNPIALILTLTLTAAQGYNPGDHLGDQLRPVAPRVGQLEGRHGGVRRGSPSGDPGERCTECCRAMACSC